MVAVCVGVGGDEKRVEGNSVKVAIDWRLAAAVFAGVYRVLLVLALH